MNAARRKDVDAILEKIAKLRADSSVIEEIRGNIDDVKNDEEEARDNLPESMRDGERGQAMDTAIENMESAISELEDVESSLEQVEQYLNEAKGDA